MLILCQLFLAQLLDSQSSNPLLCRNVNFSPNILRKKSTLYSLYIYYFLLLIFNRKKLNISTLSLFYKGKIDIKSTFTQHKHLKLDI